MASVSNISTDSAIPAAPAISPLVAPDKNRIERVKDSEGRTIGAKKLDALAVFEISILLGDHASNQAVLSQALMAASVVEIDGELIARPQSLIGLKALISRLDFAGYEAASAAVAKFAPAVAVNKAALKN